MPPKRATAAVTADENKRYKSAIDEMANEFVCPITQELPLEPVTAEDGHCYEREAIESWIRQRAGQPLRSPVTNKSIGRKLFPAVQVKNTIRSMVKSGAISGDKAGPWKARIEGEEKVVKTRRRAEQGNPDAIHMLGTWYDDGSHGLVKDAKQAFVWFKKGADLHVL